MKEQQINCKDEEVLVWSLLRYPNNCKRKNELKSWLARKIAPRGGIPYLRIIRSTMSTKTAERSLVVTSVVSSAKKIKISDLK